ncbi:MAG: gamma-glutamylcyclotransferase [Proteobacteria bacterium]|nr:gamma-glutamylcyclotransferase [Pseudomonadota bacterium]
MTERLVWYFAYGSNMDPARLAEDRLKPRGVALAERIGGRLEGWRLVFNKRARTPVGSGAGNIVPAGGAAVYGTLNAMPAEGIDVLDVWEGVAGGHYERRLLPVLRADTGAMVEAVTYVALLTGDDLRPTRAYLGHLLAGRDLLPPDYWEWLKATPTVD